MRDKWTKKGGCGCEYMEMQMDSLILRLMTNVYNCITAMESEAEQPAKSQLTFESVFC